jgi:protein-S-isoprenylcysteine O-methyltransferase Ste14
VTTACWIVLGVIWAIGALRSKPAIRSENARTLAAHLTLTTLAFALLFAFENGHFILGDAITVAGTAIAIWARLTLKGNWSATVTIKQEHEFIETGPYAFVRHPIYTGLLLAMLGTSIARESWISLLSVPVAGFAWWRKLQTEEQFLTQQFGPRYADYRSRVRALIPGVL